MQCRSSGFPREQASFNAGPRFNRALESGRDCSSAWLAAWLIFADLEVERQVPPASGHKQELPSLDDALSRLHLGVLAVLVKFQEPLDEGGRAGHICAILTGNHTFSPSSKQSGENATLLA